MTGLSKLSESEFETYLKRVSEEQTKVGLSNLPRYKPGGWCECGDEKVGTHSSYFERPDGSHGFFHDTPSCGKLTQSG